MDKSFNHRDILDRFVYHEYAPYRWPVFLFNQLFNSQMTDSINWVLFEIAQQFSLSFFAK